MNEFAMLNEPVAFPVAGKVVKFKRLSTATRKSLIISYYVEQRVAEITSKAKAFDDVKARTEYVAKEVDKIQSGDALTEAAMEAKVDEEMVVRFISKAVVDLDREGCEALYREGTGPEVRAIVEFITQSKKNLSSPQANGE